MPVYTQVLAKGLQLNETIRSQNSSLFPALQLFSSFGKIIKLIFKIYA